MKFNVKPLNIEKIILKFSVLHKNVCSHLFNTNKELLPAAAGRT